MDLLQTVRKEGSRGGRATFSWDEVKGDAHRENYLGHSLMAPVGRWQKGRDLSWYARGDGKEVDAETQKAREADARKEEIRKIKEAESDELARALGYEVPDRNATQDNPNLTELGDGAKERKRLREAVDEGLGDDEEGGGKGLGFGGYSGTRDMGDGDDDEVMEGTKMPTRDTPRGEDHKRRERRRWDEHRERKSRSSKSDRKHHGRDRSRDRRHKRSRSPERHRDRHERRERNDDAYDRSRHYRRERDGAGKDNEHRQRPRRTSRSPDGYHRHERRDHR